jgi:aminoglycoside 6'-N-acetyltransferase
VADAGFTALTSARLVLRRFRPADLDAFVAYRSDPQIARYQSWEAPYRPSQARQLLAELEAIHLDTPGDWFQFAVAPAGDRPAGRRLRNLRSAAVLERAGMRREGHLLESTRSKGEWTSDLLYAVLRREWSTDR